MADVETKWVCKSFPDLNNEELYKILQLRNAVFVIEQNSVYQDCDDKDQPSYHLMGWKNKNLVAYSRLIPPGVAFDAASIGRVVTATSARRQKIGRELMNLSIKYTFQLFGENPITIGAQSYLRNFYKSMGFIEIGDVYMEDGIEHIKMHRSQTNLMQ